MRSQDSLGVSLTHSCFRLRVENPEWKIDGAAFKFDSSSTVTSVMAVW